MSREEAIEILKDLWRTKHSTYLDADIRKALDMAIQALEQEPAYCDRNICLRNEYNGIGCDECEVTKSQEPKAEKVIKMRDATPEEQEAIDRYIKSISKPTGINIFDFYKDDEKSCNNCKHHLKFMCKNWKTCHDYSDWELEELDFVQPKKSIPCTIKVQADGEYISKEKAIIQLSWDLSEVELPRIKESLDKLPSVAIPNKVGHWVVKGSHDTYYGLDDFICSECGERVSKEGEWLYEFCPRCGSPMEHEDED